MTPRVRLAATALAGLMATAGPAAAQVVSCSQFLHNRDGSWSSFAEADLAGRFGLVHIHPGERFRVGGPRVLSDIARTLDAVCSSD